MHNKLSERYSLGSMGSGKLVLITGPMFAGKTTKLISEMSGAIKKKKKTILFKSAVDNRYSKSEVVSHDGLRLRAEILPEGKKCAVVLRNAAKKYDVIGIDEGHFWEDTEGLSEILEEISKNSTVYVSMLNRNSINGDKFDLAKNLAASADKVHLINSKCTKCGKKATFTQRVAKYQNYSNAAMVGGSESYEARCAKCFVPLSEPY